MKLITTPPELNKEFARLSKKYKTYYWATAWAGASMDHFKELLNSKEKISKMIVGIHFYQTHPDFIAEFVDSKKVKFIMQPEGTFHPKLYVFYNDDTNWEILVGSANFTNAAFTQNTEATSLISSSDVGSEMILKQAITLIEEVWINAKSISNSELDKYRIVWKNHKPKINSLTGQYGSVRKINKPIYKAPVAIMTWKDFVKRIEKEPHHTPSDRLGVITKCRELFESVDHFKDLPREERKFIAGIPNLMDAENYLDWGLFGSMKGAGKFKNKIISNDLNISLALDQIPLKGQITKSHYDAFITYFDKAFHGVGTATRLLAMKRPDTFICFVSKNKSRLCEEFEVKQSDMTYERYWSEIVERIFDSEWWLNPNPKTKEEEKIAEARAAFLDALYYDA